MASNKDLNRLKVILAEKKKSNLWLNDCIKVVYKLVTTPVGIADEDNETS